MADCRLMLHFNGSNGQTNTVDRTGRHSITFNGTAQLSTTNPKFGTACLLLDGDSDYLTLANSADWNICAVANENWTIDFWVKHVDHVGVERYISQYQDAQNYWHIYHVHGSGIRFLVGSSASYVINSGYGTEITDSLWHHIALCRVGDEYGLYLDGVQCAYVQDATLKQLAGPLTIGYADSTYYFDGRIDELRIDKSNHFNASPNSGLTDMIDIVSPVGHYKLDDDAADTVVADSSGNGFTGTLEGGRVTSLVSIAGQVDEAFDINDSSAFYDYVDTGDPFESIFQDSFSISLSVKPDDGQPGTTQILMGNTDTTGANSGVEIQITTAGKVLFSFESEGHSGNIAQTNAVVFSDGPASAWTDITVVADSTVGGVGGKKIYINGSEVALDASLDGSTSGVVFADFASAFNAFVGAGNRDGVASLLFAGGLDNVMIFNKALTAAEVLALYTAESGGELGLTAAYEDYELLPEFPSIDNGDISRGVEISPFNADFTEDGVRRSAYSDGYPLVDPRYSFQQQSFGLSLTWLTDADKNTLTTFYKTYAAREIAVLNPTDSLKYHCIFEGAPKLSVDQEKGKWKMTFTFRQVSSTTWS